MYVCVCTVWFLSGGCGKKSDMKSGGSEARVNAVAWNRSNGRTWSH